MQLGKECDKILVRHNSICLTRQGSVHFSLVKMHARFSILSCVSGVVSQQSELCVFRVHDFGYAPFFNGGEIFMRDVKKVCRIILIMALCLSLTACACDHEWINATCTSPVTCSKCGETAGDPATHHWVSATCETSKTCSSCRLTEGEPLGHEWIDPNCVMPKTCSSCDATEGTELGHIWADATCTTPKTCSVCEQTEGEPLGHEWKDATYAEPKTCTICGETEGSALTSSNNNSGNNNGSNDTPKCLLCGNSVSRSSTLYCSTHDCAACSLPAKNVNGAWGSYCEYHGCREPGCLSIPIGGTSYCGAHGD